MEKAIKKTVLNNGIKILSQTMPQVRSVSMGVWVNVGARDETAKENGLSHLIEHMIFKGTKQRNTFQIAKEFDAIGGNTNAFTTMENTCYHAKVMDTHLEKMTDILSDIFLNSVFDEIEVEKERPVILQELGMVEDSPEELIHILFSKNFWGNNPLGRSILGTRENITRFKARHIKKFFNKFYHPESIIISVAGNVEHNRFVDLIGPLFETVQSKEKSSKRKTPSEKPVVHFQHKDLEQVHICIGTKGISISDPKRYGLSLLNIILGGNMSSRLFQEIRERRGLAYSVYSFMSSYVDTGMIGVYAGVDSSKTQEAVEVILDQIDRFKVEKVDPTELKGAKEYSRGSLYMASESTENQMVRLAQNELHFGRYISLKEVIDKIEKVTEEDIMRLSNEFFAKERLAITALGPVSNKKTIEKILKNK